MLSPVTDASPDLLLPPSPDPSAATQSTAVHLTQPSTDSSDPSAATQSTTMYLAQSSTDSVGLSAATQPTAMFFTQPSVSSTSSPTLVIQFFSVCLSTDHTTCPPKVHLPAPSPVTDPCSSFLFASITRPSSSYSADSNVLYPTFSKFIYISAGCCSIFITHVPTKRMCFQDYFMVTKKVSVYNSLSTWTKHDKKRIQLLCMWSSYVIRRSYTIPWTVLLPLC